MINELSCWKFDWSAAGAVGAWVGGIGAAAAAWAAFYISRREDRRRERYAKFLFEEDVEILRNIERKLADILFFSASKSYALDAKEHLIDGHWKILLRYIGQFEYFSSSEQKFYYSPNKEDLEIFMDNVSLLQMHRDAPRLTERVLGEGIGELSVIELKSKLKNVLDKWDKRS